MSSVLSYLPWSEQNANACLTAYERGEIPILDLQLSASCRLRREYGGCIYCDSRTGKPDANELTFTEIQAIVEQAIPLGLKWVFICGLGEPKDDPKLFPLIDLLTSKTIGLSMFTNGIGFTREDVEFLRMNHVNMLVKCDSLNPSVFNKLLGTEGEGIAQSVYHTIKLLLEAGYGGSDKDGSDLALSIVPTQLNHNDIPEVVKFCKEQGIFPLLGQLECAGRATRLFDTLALSDEELLKLKNSIEQILGQPYEIPICPAGIAGLHISNVGECIVHRGTGLSCPWFDLAEPEVESLGNVREVSLRELWKEVRRYRAQRIEDIRQWVDKVSKDIFGGCGGKGLLETYLRIESTLDKVPASYGA